MKSDELKIGMKVVATSSSNATVYTVKKINNLSIALSFMSDDIEIDAGTLDSRFLNIPTLEQLANA